MMTIHCTPPISQTMKVIQCSRQLLSAARCASKTETRTTCRLLHASAARDATLLPHPSAPGPPPKAPVPAPSHPDERIARKKKHAELLKIGQTLRANEGKQASKTSTPLAKRFWKHANVKETEDGFEVRLDARPVRVPSKDILVIPRSKRQLALAIALEWESVATAQQALKQHYIPLTALAARAMDIQQADLRGDASVRDSIITMALRYLTTDTLLCWAPEPDVHNESKLEWKRRHGKSLRELQRQAAQPIISFLTTHVWPGVEIVPVLDAESIFPKEQPEMTATVIKGWLSGLPAFELAGLERGILASKSLLIAVRLVVEWSQEFAHLWGKDIEATGKRFGIEEAREAGNIEVIWQTRMWGEVEDSHDVDKEDVRRQLGSVILLVNGEVDRHQA